MQIDNLSPQDRINEIAILLASGIERLILRENSNKSLDLALYPSMYGNIKSITKSSS